MRGTTIAAVLAITATGGVAAATAPTGFDALAARGTLVEVRAPMWTDGTLRVGAGVGTVKRRALGKSVSSDPYWPEFARVERYGRVRFDVAGAEVGGALTGDCRYGREEERVEGGIVTLSRPTAPLRLLCTFARDGAALGTLRLAAAPGARETARVGEVRVGDAVLALRSTHRLGTRGVRTDAPVGYAMAAGGVDVAAVDLNGVTRRRVALPTAASAQRDAALLAGIALAVFWDPGDTDD